MSSSKRNWKEVRRFYDLSAKNNNNSLFKRSQTRIFHLRNFNNWMKSTFINKYLKHDNFNTNAIRILDLCCGKGGDQLKWLKGYVNHVTFIDLSRDSIDICHKRYSQLLRREPLVYHADFYVANCSDDNLADVLKGCDLYSLVSCQFALHYAFESIGQTRKILENVSGLLKTNGYFIASIPNAYEIVKRAKEAFTQNMSKHLEEDGVLKFGNSIYSISFPPSSYSFTELGDNKELKFPLFGAEYTFHLDEVVDCPEYLVYPPLLNDLALEYGLIPVQDTIPFSNHFYDSIGSEDNAPLELLARMKALEPLHIDGENVHIDSTEYQHVLNRNEADNGVIGTLSNSEWEVATIYSFVAYKKC